MRAARPRPRRGPVSTWTDTSCPPVSSKGALLGLLFGRRPAGCGRCVGHVRKDLGLVGEAVATGVSARQLAALRLALALRSHAHGLALALRLGDRDLHVGL